jgi:hypothetical protein
MWTRMRGCLPRLDTIGYAVQVLFIITDRSLAGSQPSFHKMVDDILHSLNPWRPRVPTCNIWDPSPSWRTGVCRLGVGFGSVMAFFISASGMGFIEFISVLLTKLVAELVSAYSTAGGIYFISMKVVPPEHAAIWSWVIGWCNLLGQTAGVASVAYTVSQMILAAVSMNSKTNGVSYVYSPYVFCIFQNTIS